MGRVVFALMTLWLAAPLAVGGQGFGLSWQAALAGALVLAAAVSAAVAARLAALLRPSLDSRLLAAAALVIAAAAIAQTSRLAVFMADVRRTEYSLVPQDAWRTRHCCLTSYAEAARLAAEGEENIYDATHYRPAGVVRYLGPLQVDVYHYPPPFLLPGRALHLVTTDFFRIRALWFAGQVLVLTAVVIGLAMWVGPRRGGLVLVGGLLVLSLPPTLYSLQQGNFQSTAMALGLAGFVLVVSRRYPGGALLLAYAAMSKVFPGILVVPLVTARRWGAVAWIAAAGAALIAISVAVMGVGPWREFVGYELPRISDGRAFPHSELPQNMASNQSIYGQTVRLRRLGATWLDSRTGLRVASVYGLLVLVFAGWIGRVLGREGDAPLDRVLILQIALALLGLASFRSPFVGGGYGLVSTYWLMTMLAARADSHRGQVGWLFAALALALVSWQIPSPQFPVTTNGLLLSSAVFLAAFSINVFGVVQAWMTSVAPRRVAVPLPDPA